jgi:hypothetical protein
MSEDNQSITENSEGLATIAASSVMSSEASNGTFRGRTSWVWQHMPGPPETIYLVNGMIHWRCKHCESQYKLAGGTAAISRHLMLKHGLEDTNQKAKVKEQVVQTSIQAAMELARQNQQKRRRQQPDIYEPEYFDSTVFESLLIQWIACDSVPFSMVESSHFRALLIYLNSAVFSVLPSSSNTLTTWTKQHYNLQRISIQEELSVITQKINFSIDLWTGNSNKAYIGLIAHYFDINRIYKSPTLALREIIGPHTGENQAKYVVEIMLEFDLLKRVGYWMMDNATNNDTLLKSLAISTLII